MSYVNRQIDDFAPEPTAVVNKVSDYHDLVRWGPILSGLVVALATQLILSALGGAIGTAPDSGAPRSNAGEVGTGVGIWSIISLFLSLFVGG